jgi:hypothetical protein
MDTNIIPDYEWIWIFCEEESFACFVSKKQAFTWIMKTKVSGCLTRYPLNISIYDWAISNHYFSPKFPSHNSAKFIQKFSSAYLEHYHFEFDDEGNITSGYEEIIEELGEDVTNLHLRYVGSENIQSN